MARTDDIPQDVWAAAGNALGSSLMVRATVRTRIARTRIALAILAERERCAAIAEADNTPAYAPHRDDMEHMAEIQRKRIAAAIRKGGE